MQQVKPKWMQGWNVIMWEYKGMSYDGDTMYECTECERIVFEQYPYCPYCGRKQKIEAHHKGEEKKNEQE